MPGQVDNKKICSVCGRGKSGHKTPFGKNCDLPPLEPEERERVRKQIMGEIEEDTGSGGSGSTSGQDSDYEDSVNYEHEVEKLLEEKKALERQKQLSQKALDGQKKLVEKQKYLKQMEKIKLEMEQLKLGIEANQAEFIALKSLTPTPEVAPDNQPAATPAFGNPAVNRKPPAAPAVQPVPIPGLTSLPGQSPIGATALPSPGLPVPSPYLAAMLDPSMQVYVAALAQQKVQPGVAQPGVVKQSVIPDDGEDEVVPGLGATALQLINANPLLAAACGAKGTAKASDEGKWVAENFVLKSLKDKDKPNYFEFINGAFRMSKKRCKENKPCSKFIDYYEMLSGFAMMYKWPAVFDLHETLSKQSENQERELTDPVNFTDAYAFLNARAMLPDDRVSDEPRLSRRERARANCRAAGDGDMFRSESEDSRVTRPKVTARGRLCMQFNCHPLGCSYGSQCKFMHACTICEGNGITAFHAAIHCVSRAMGSSVQPCNNGPIGGGGAISAAGRQ